IRRPSYPDPGTAAATPGTRREVYRECPPLRHSAAHAPTAGDLFDLPVYAYNGFRVVSEPVQVTAWRALQPAARVPVPRPPRPCLPCLERRRTHLLADQRGPPWAGRPGRTLPSCPADPPTNPGSAGSPAGGGGEQRLEQVSAGGPGGCCSRHRN